MLRSSQHNPSIGSAKSQQWVQRTVRRVPNVFVDSGHLPSHWQSFSERVFGRSLRTQSSLEEVQLRSVPDSRLEKRQKSNKCQRSTCHPLYTCTMRVLHAFSDGFLASILLPSQCDSQIQSANNPLKTGCSDFGDEGCKALQNSDLMLL